MEAYYSQTDEGKSSVSVIVTLADLYRLDGEMPEAEQWIKRADQIDAKSQTVIHTRCMWLLAQNRLDELAGISSAYLAAEDQNPSILVKAGSVLAASDSIILRREGLKLFEHAVSLSPASTEAQVGLASALFRAGESEHAKEVYQELLGQHPFEIRVLNDLAWILQECDGAYEAALELADRGLRLEPGNLHLLDTRGVILSKMAGRLADAKTDFEELAKRSLSDSPRQARALLQLGRVCSQLNEPEKARLHLEKAIQSDREIGVFSPEERSEIASLAQPYKAAARPSRY